MEFFWTVAVCLLLVLEASTAQFVSIWFAGGALGALIASLFHLTLITQIIVFIVISALLLIFTKPFIQKLKQKGTVRTNADALIGQNGVVVERINNLLSCGSVKINGIVWSARSSDSSDIESGKIVEVEKIEGVKLIVKLKED